MPDFHIRDASRLSLLTWKKRVTYIASDDLHPRHVQLGCVTDDLQPRRVQLGRVTDDPSAATRPDKTHHWCGSQQRRILAKRFTNHNLQKQKKENLYYGPLCITHVSSISAIKFYTNIRYNLSYKASISAIKFYTNIRYNLSYKASAQRTAA